MLVTHGAIARLIDAIANNLPDSKVDDKETGNIDCFDFRFFIIGGLSITFQPAHAEWIATISARMDSPCDLVLCLLRGFHRSGSFERRISAPNCGHWLRFAGICQRQSPADFTPWTKAFAYLPARNVAPDYGGISTSWIPLRHRNPERRPDAHGICGFGTSYRYRAEYG